ncbi:MAG: hypothetical protein JWP15_2758, partial [Alphaproteobacteria bacterium]|nr:hypothetical protein [Alphaproteobacteria bacterium]
MTFHREIRAFAAMAISGGAIVGNATGLLSQNNASINSS